MPRPLNTRPCSVDGCEATQHCRELCGLHYRRLRAHGAPGSAARLKAPKGSGSSTVHGYRVVFMPDHPNARPSGYIFEHVLRLTEMIGRPLLPGENVHHKNGVKDDNRPENLELWVIRQPKGQRPSDLLVWAQEIVARYGHDPQFGNDPSGSASCTDGAITRTRNHPNWI